MAEAAVSFLLQSLKDLGVQIYNLHKNADKESRGLQKDLEILQAKLKDATASTTVPRGSEFRVWENLIRDAVYDAEDLINDFVTQELGSGRGITFKKIDLAASLKGFRNEINSFLQDPNIKGFPHLTSSSTSTWPDDPTKKTRQVLPYTDKTVVGFEDEIENLAANVLGDTRGVEVISITGMPGLGKTTVAWKIFRDPRIEHDFPTRIWIVVSQEYKAKNIYLTILKSFTNQDLSNRTDLDLAKKSEDYLSQVKFLLVVDDVWTNGAWDAVKLALPMTKGSGKVLMTSRHEAVANYAITHKPPHKLRFLTEDESWKLLQYEVYGKEPNWPADLKTIGLTISEKCGGLPLAIVVIGGILKEKIDPPESRKVEWSRVSQRTGEYFMGKDKEQSMAKIIALSYDAVPYSLRDGLLYFGLYPNNMEISVWNLTRLRIAEGFIKKEDML